MAAVEDPIHRVTGKDVGNLLLGRQDDQGGLQQAGSDHWRGLGFRNHNGTRRVSLKRMGWFPRVQRRGSQREMKGYGDGDGRLHGSCPFWGYSVSPWAKRAMPS